MIGERKGCIKPTREANEVSLAHPKSENLMLAFFFSLYKEGTRFLWSTFPTLLIAAIELIVIDYQLGIQIHTRRSGTLKTGTRTGAIEVLKEFFLSRCPTLLLSTPSFSTETPFVDDLLLISLSEGNGKNLCCLTGACLGSSPHGPRVPMYAFIGLSVGFSLHL